MTAAPRLRFDFREYLTVDEASEARHEFLDGLILGMAGGTPEHARIAAAIVAALSAQLAGKRCAVFSAALRVRSNVTGFAGYPDVSVVCGTIERDPENANTVTNPSVVVEVLSPSTAEYDAGEKLRQYQTMASVLHVVLVAHDVRRIDVWSRTESAFTKASFAAGSIAELPGIGCSLDVDGVYRDPLGS